MKMLRKIISSMLTTVMILSLSTNMVFASVAQDVKDTKYKTEATVLGALNIMVGDAYTGNFRPQDPIKRSEATKIGVALMGLTNIAESSAHYSSYPDVDKDYWANGFINTATNHSLVIGDDTGNFRPEDQIKYTEVATILVRALGYEPQAKNKGGYPAGYMSVASSIGLTKGVDLSSGSLIARGDVAIMAYNALTIKLMEQTGFGSNIKYEITDKTLLEDNLNITLIKGKVNAVGSSVLDSGSPLSKNEIRIGDKNYSAGKTDIRTILGFNAEAYLNNKTKELIAVVPEDGANNVLNIDADSISSVENTLAAKAVIYWQNPDTSSKTSKAAVENDAFVIYNGKKADFSKFTGISSGYMSLLDTDSNGKYDIVFINETSNYVIDEVYPASKKITDKYSMPTLTLDFEDESKTVILEKSNEYIDLSKLSQWDVITFTISEDESIIFGNVVTNPIQGKITEISDNHVYIGDKKYSVAANYPTSFSVNDEGVFYIDYEGKIAAFDGVKNHNANYAYLENAAVSTGLSKSLKLELFTKEGKFEILECVPKMAVNSSKNLGADEALSAIGGTGKLVTFEKDSAGKVKKIVTANVSGDINEDVFTLNITEDDVAYRASSSKLTAANMSVSITEDTVIFDIPQNGHKSDYAVRSKSVFADGGLYDVMIFDVSQNYKAGAVIITDSDADADEASDIAVVDKITISKNSVGDSIHKLYAFSGGKAVTLDSKDMTTFIKTGTSLIKAGDIIQFRKNAQGEVDKIKVLFDTDATNEESKTKVSDNLTTVYGKVVKKFTDSVNVQIGSANAENYEISKATVYVYDSALSKNKVRVGDISDVERYENNGGKIFMKIYKDEVKEIVVIK